MTWLINKLTKRIIFMKGEQIPDPLTGGARTTYEPLVTVWAGIAPLGIHTVYSAYIRAVQIMETATHKITVRRNPSIGVVAEGESGVIKADHFIFQLSSQTPNTGRIYRIIAAAGVTTSGIGEETHYDILVKELGILDTGRGVIS